MNKATLLQNFTKTLTEIKDHSAEVEDVDLADVVRSCSGSVGLAATPRTFDWLRMMTRGI